MIQLALRLTLAGVGDYWDDVDRYVRNQFAQMQMRSSDWVYRMIEGHGDSPIGLDESGDHVPERCVGGFGGWTSANDFYVGVGNGMMNCCTGNCSRALYYVWENIAEVTNGGLRVNLLLNRSLGAAEIVSQIPDAGRVSIRSNQALGSVAVRTPEWIDSGSADLTCTVNGARRPVRWDERYALVEGVSAGDTLVYDFPIADRTVRETIGEVDYSLVIRGNTVTSISPEGTNYPFYADTV